MKRFYVDGPLQIGAHTTLTQSDSHHASHVLRLTPGAEVELMDGTSRFVGTIRTLSPQVTVTVMGELPTTEPRIAVTLYQGVPKGDKMERIVQKAVELGAKAIVPVAMERSVVKLTHADGERKRQRWQKIALEAGKQAGRCAVVQVEEPIALQALLQQRSDTARPLLIPWEDAVSGTLPGFVAAHPGCAALDILIGPEGGISRNEMSQLQAVAGMPVTLGPRILRTETAGMVTLAALMCLYGEMA